MLRFPLALSLALAFLAGCTKSDSAAPATAKVGGKVMLDGQPMAGGEVRFSFAGQPVKSFEIKGGAFAGDAYIGKNRVEIVWDKDGKPNTMNPGTFLKVNAVSDQFSGPNSTLSADVTAAGATDLKFDVKASKK